MNREWIVRIIGMILVMESTNGRRRYIVTSSIIGWAYAQVWSPWVQRMNTLKPNEIEEKLVFMLSTNHKHVKLD